MLLSRRWRCRDSVPYRKGCRRVRQELREFGVPISPKFALAMRIAPASLKRLTKVASRGGRSFA